MVMKEIIPPPPGIVRNDVAAIKQLFQKYVVPSYGRFEVAFSHGAGTSVWDVTGKRYLDLGGGIAVCALGHAHPRVTEALIEQSRKLMHVSNLYYHEPQGRLAERIVGHLGSGKVFFCNSGAEANEGLYKIARKFGNGEGRFEIITAANSFHGRTLAGLAATGQEKFRKGFEPTVPGFRHVPFNDLAAMENAISPGTAAILIEGVQGEGGIDPAAAEYLVGLRRLCDEKKLLLLMDSVQCGHFRTGRFQSFQRILEQVEGGQGFLPDGISMAKSLGGGFPMGAFWVREPFQDLLGPGTHGTTFGGTPLGCAVALAVFDVIQEEGLADNARREGHYLLGEISRLAKTYPGVIAGGRGLGLMIGIQLAHGISGLGGTDKAASFQFVNRLHRAGVLAIPSGANVVRLLPPLNLRHEEAEEGIELIESVVKELRP